MQKQIQSRNYFMTSHITNQCSSDIAKSGTTFQHYTQCPTEGNCSQHVTEPTQPNIFLNPKIAILTQCPILSSNFCSLCFSHNSSWWDKQCLWLSLAFWHCSCPPVVICHTGLWEQYCCTCDNCTRHIPRSTTLATYVCYMWHGPCISEYSNNQNHKHKEVSMTHVITMQIYSTY